MDSDVDMRPSAFRGQQDIPGGARAVPTRQRRKGGGGEGVPKGPDRSEKTDGGGAGGEGEAAARKGSVKARKTSPRNA